MSLDKQFDSEILKIFQQVFNRKDLVINDETQAKDVDSWDSLNHVTLIMAIESHFEIRFSTREMMGFQNVGGMKACLKQKL